MPKVFTSPSQRTGELGETIAVKYLQSRGFAVIERNYTKKWGELDIVATKNGLLHFVEVKSVKYRSYRPEEQVHARKIARLRRTIETYTTERQYEGEWVFDLILVYLDDATRTAAVTCMENIVI